MFAELMFHVYEYINCEDRKIMNGRVIRSIRIGEELIVVDNLHFDYYKKKCDENERIEICNEENYEEIKIEEIFSYGRYWEELPEMMSAQLRYSCKREDLKSDLVFRIVKDSE